MRVSDVLREKGADVISVAPTTRIADVVAVLAEYRIGAVAVLSGRQLVGVLSERDILREMARSGHGILDDCAEKVMSLPIHVCGLNDPVDALMSTMTAERVRHLPVLHEDVVVGMISIGDVVKRRVMQLQVEADQLAGYIASGR